MKFGKQRIHDLPINDITTLGALAQRLQQEAEARGDILPPPSYLHIGEPSFHTPEHIRLAAIESIESERLTYGPAAGWPWLRELIAAKIERVNGYLVEPQHVAIAMGGTGAILAALTATVSPGDEVLLPDPGWPQYILKIPQKTKKIPPHTIELCFVRCAWLDASGLSRLRTAVAAPLDNPYV